MEHFRKFEQTEIAKRPRSSINEANQKLRLFLLTPLWLTNRAGWVKREEHIEYWALIDRPAFFIPWRLHSREFDNEIEPGHIISRKIICTLSEVSDQPVHLRTLNRFFAETAQMRLIWVFSGRTCSLVGNSVPRLKFNTIVSRFRSQTYLVDGRFYVNVYFINQRTNVLLWLIAAA